ncbi:hypothetical protein ACFLRC_03455 [Candidatus Altiarchaeota archaeon]
MEWITTYGLAVMVVMLVGMFLWRTGYLQVSEATGKGNSGFQGVKVMDFSLYQCDGWEGRTKAFLDLVLVNSEPGNINVTETQSFTLCGDLCPTEWYWIDKSAVFDPNGCPPFESGDIICNTILPDCPAMPPGETGRFVTMLLNEDLYEGSLDEGTKYDLEVVIKYNDLKSGLPHTSRGKLWTTPEKIY